MHTCDGVCLILWECRELAEIAAVGAWSKDDPLADTDLRSIMHTLRYDGFVEEARSGGGRAVDPADPPYRLIGQPSSVTPLATVPCGSCPVRLSASVHIRARCVHVCVVCDAR